MIRVLYILPGIDGGGIGEIVCTYLKHIDKKSFVCDVATLDTPDGHKPFAYDRMAVCANHLFLLDRHSYWRRFVQLREIYNKGDYDIVHAHMDNISFVYLLQAYLHGIKVRIAHSHIAYKPRIGSGDWNKSLLNPFLRLITTHKFGCGEMACRFLWGNSNNCYVMPNAIELNRFEYSIRKDIQFRKELDITPDKKIVGTVGRFNEQKNPFFILDIIKKLIEKRTDFLFLWVGSGELYNTIVDKAREYGIDEYIRFLGLRSDVNYIFSLFDVFILPSLYEGLPIVGVESQAASLPSLFSNTITKEIAITDKATFLDINDAENWSVTISDLFDKSYDRSDNGMNRSHYNIEIAVHELENRYKLFLNNN